MRLSSLFISLVTLCLLQAAAVAAPLASTLPTGDSAGKLAQKQPPKGTVVVHDSAVVHGDHVLLKHIAEVNGFSDQERSRIERIYLSRSPQPGNTKIYNERFIRKMLLAYAKEGSWKIPQQVSVRRDVRRIKVEQLKKLFTDAVLRQAKVPSNRVEVKSLNLNQDLLIPSGPSEIEIGFMPSETFRGRATAKVTVTVNKQKYKDFYISGDVAIKGDALRVVNKVERGQPIGPADIELQEIELSNAPRTVLLKAESAIGMVATAPLTPGMLLTENLVDAPEVIKRGDMVSLVVETSTMRLEAKGIAQQDGKLNQTIKVLNVSSDKVVYGRVTRPEEVQVLF